MEDIYLKLMSRKYTILTPEPLTELRTEYPIPSQQSNILPRNTHMLYSLQYERACGPCVPRV